MGLESRDYMRDVPEYRRLVGREAPAAAGGGGTGGQPPTTWSDPPQEPPWWGQVGGSRTRTRPWAWFLLGVIVTLGTVGYVAENGIPFVTSQEPPITQVIPTPRGAPPQAPTDRPGRTVAMMDGIPVVGPPLRIEIDGKSTHPAGTRVEMTGRSTMERAGPVVVKLRWNGGAWETVQRTRATRDGSYRVNFVLDRRGRAQLRIVFEGGSFAYKWYRVT